MKRLLTILFLLGSIAVFGQPVGMAMYPQVSSITYATLNASDKGANITCTTPFLTWSQVGVGSIRSTISKSSGKWYVEVKNLASHNILNSIGFGKSTASNSSFVGADANAYGWLADGDGAESRIYNNGGAIAGGPSATYTTNDIIMLAMDLDNHLLYWGKNGTWLGSANPSAGTGAPVTGISGSWFIMCGDAGSATGTVNFGATAFTYTPPTGYNSGLF